MENFGRIDMDKVHELARMAGISADELEAALAERGLINVSFCA